MLKTIEKYKKFSYYSYGDLDLRLGGFFDTVLGDCDNTLSFSPSAGNKLQTKEKRSILNMTSSHHCG